MLLILFCAGIAADAPRPAQAAPAQKPAVAEWGEARAVMNRQLLQPPRIGTAGGMTAEEAEVVTKRYIASVGAPVRSGSGSGDASNADTPRKAQ